MNLAEGHNVKMYQVKDPVLVSYEILYPMRSCKRQRNHHGNILSCCLVFEHLIHRLRLVNQPLGHLLQPRILDRSHLLHIPAHTKGMIMYKSPPTHRLLARESRYVVRKVGVFFVVRVRLVLHEARVEPKWAAVEVSLQRLRATNLGNTLGIFRDGAYDPGVARVEYVGNAGEFRGEPKGFFVTWERLVSIFFYAVSFCSRA